MFLREAPAEQKKLLPNEPRQFCSPQFALPALSTRSGHCEDSRETVSPGFELEDQAGSAALKGQPERFKVIRPF
jgi:hypothetical protein